MIATRKDLDAAKGTLAYDAFMTALGGSIYRSEFNIENQAWEVTIDDSRIKSFGFNLSDFANVEPPDVSALSIPSVTVPKEISDRQFFEQLANMKLITEDEALAAVATGTLPAALAAFVDTLPTEQQFSAKMALQGATTFLRDNPLVAAFGAMQGMSKTDIDDFWRAAAAL